MLCLGEMRIWGFKRIISFQGLKHCVPTQARLRGDEGMASVEPQALGSFARCHSEYPWIVKKS